MCLRILDIKRTKGNAALQNTNSYGIYKNQSGVRILTIGDGDLSFTLNLAKHIPKCRVVGTTYLSKTEFKSVYSDAENMLNSASMLSNLRIIHSVDATQLGKKKSPLAHSPAYAVHTVSVDAVQAVVSVNPAPHDVHAVHVSPSP